MPDQNTLPNKTTQHNDLNAAAAIVLSISWARLTTSVSQLLAMKRHAGVLTTDHKGALYVIGGVN